MDAEYFTKADVAYITNRGTRTEVGEGVLRVMKMKMKDGGDGEKMVKMMLMK